MLVVGDRNLRIVRSGEVDVDGAEDGMIGEDEGLFCILLDLRNVRFG